MKRQAFLLGLFSTGAQVLMLRELVSSFHGDELLLGTALFGWLLAVAGGALVGGGRMMVHRVRKLLVLASLVLLVMIVITRLIPVVLTDSPGEFIPFTTAATMSVLLMLPVGLFSGMLFPAIAAKGRSSRQGVTQVYLFEGLGAFVGGLILTVMIGTFFTTLGMAVLLGLTVLWVAYRPERRVVFVILLIGLHGAMLIVWNLIPHVDQYLDSLKYSGYEVRLSTDTHYGHQAVFERDGHMVLVSDNTIEASSPDPVNTQNMLIPPLLYRPDATRVLYVGRSEFGLAELAAQIPQVEVTAIDPRGSLTEALKRLVPGSDSMRMLDEDPVSYVSGSDDLYDIVILDVGLPDTYRTSRLFTPRYGQKISRLLADSGLVFFPVDIDTERYVAAEQADVLAVIHNTLLAVFDSVHLWPGEKTLFFASNTLLFDLPIDTLVGRANLLECRKDFFEEFFLRDRLNDFRVERLNQSLAGTHEINSLDKPVLPHFQAICRAKVSGGDSRLLPWLMGSVPWIPGLLIGLVAIFVTTLIGVNRQRRFGLFLYFAAGFVSLTLELISFYQYQSLAGSLYAELALLVGAFMLGLASGTYLGGRWAFRRLDAVSLLILLGATTLFMSTSLHISYGWLPLYHAVFQFAVALGTGLLFVAATRRYYCDGGPSHRGAGYATELFGSACGALLTTTVLLPLIGMQWLLLAVLGLVLLALGRTVVPLR